MATPTTKQIQKESPARCGNTESILLRRVKYQNRKTRKDAEPSLDSSPHLNKLIRRGFQVRASPC